MERRDAYTKLNIDMKRVWVLDRTHTPQLSLTLNKNVMERRESQKEQVKKWLESGKSITPIEALYLFGVFRLSAIIYILKNDEDMPIETEMVYEDEGKRYAKYYLKES